MAKCKCLSCGFQWPHGKDGTHSCSVHLQERVQKLESALTRVATAGKALNLILPTASLNPVVTEFRAALDELTKFKT